MTLSEDHAPIDFILQNAVFTIDELKAAYRSMGRKPKWAIDAVEYHVKEGRLLRLRRGLYAHAKPFVDPWLIASKLADLSSSLTTEPSRSTSSRGWDTRSAS